jgi:hypothetical protein
MISKLIGDRFGFGRLGGLGTQLGHGGIVEVTRDGTAFEAGDGWDRSGIQSQFRSSGERQSRLVGRCQRGGRANSPDSARDSLAWN